MYSFISRLSTILRSKTLISQKNVPSWRFNSVDLPIGRVIFFQVRSLKPISGPNNYWGKISKWMNAPLPIKYRPFEGKTESYENNSRTKSKQSI